MDMPTLPTAPAHLHIVQGDDGRFLIGLHDDAPSFRRAALRNLSWRFSGSSSRNGRAEQAAENRSTLATVNAEMRKAGIPRTTPPPPSSQCILPFEVAHAGVLKIYPTPARRQVVRPRPWLRPTAPAMNRETPSPWWERRRPHLLSTSLTRLRPAAKTCRQGRDRADEKTLPALQGRMLRRRSELVPLYRDQDDDAVVLNDWYRVMCDVLVLAEPEHGCDWETFTRLARRMGIAVDEGKAMKAIHAVDKIVQRKGPHYRPMRDHTVGRLLSVTVEQRARLSIQTIAACAENPEQAAKASRRAHGSGNRGSGARA